MLSLNLLIGILVPKSSIWGNFHSLLRVAVRCGLYFRLIRLKRKMFKSEGSPMAWLDKLWLYVAIATIVGARLGH